MLLLKTTDLHASPRDMELDADWAEHIKGAFLGCGKEGASLSSSTLMAPAPLQQQQQKKNSRHTSSKSKGGAKTNLGNAMELLIKVCN